MHPSPARRRVLIILSDVFKSLNLEAAIAGLDLIHIEPSFLLFNPGPTSLQDFITKQGHPVKRLPLPSKKQYPLSFIKAVGEMQKFKPHVVHTQLFDANLLGLSAARLLNVPVRITTRHHSTQEHLYHPHAVKYDRWINSLATAIIAVSPVVSKVLTEKEGVPGQKVHLIPHGFDLIDLITVPEERVQLLRSRYSLPKGNFPTVGVIARFQHLKGLQYIIPAFKQLLVNYPSARLVIANARTGDYKQEIDALLAELPSESYRTIEFEQDLAALYQLFDLFVHTPIDAEVEAFGQIYVEALAAGIPSIFTISGIAHELAKDGVNCLVVPYKNSGAVYQAMSKLATDAGLRETLRQQGYLAAAPYTYEKMTNALNELYLK